MSVGSKRKAESSALVASKKQKSGNGSIVTHKGSSGAIISAGVRRTSNLEAPIMQLGSHEVRTIVLRQPLPAHLTPFLLFLYTGRNLLHQIPSKRQIAGVRLI